MAQIMPAARTCVVPIAQLDLLEVNIQLLDGLPFDGTFADVRGAVVLPLVEPHLKLHALEVQLSCCCRVQTARAQGHHPRCRPCLRMRQDGRRG